MGKTLDNITKRWGRSQDGDREGRLVKRSVPGSPLHSSWALLGRQTPAAEGNPLREPGALNQRHRGVTELPGGGTAGDPAALSSRDSHLSRGGVPLRTRRGASERSPP
ncbi:hypothetical protein NDU88_002540 [Pleurodeles waltl]|uniref:Uncharacterized protein n=1 Tax=Pleurodeles waltl TaxID=8319 RepID=A0AAV7M1W3_PLEWA|nr:hypothetical protein NDU88_002540 [Pleurodeles waltl]